MAGVSNPVGGGTVVRNENYSTQGDNHSTVGTGRSLPIGSTSCSAFNWLWRSPAEYTPTGWTIIWQLQMQGSPTAAISVDQDTLDWFLKSRDGSDAGVDLTMLPVEYGRWAYFVVCVRLSDTNGLVEGWMAYDNWPDVSEPSMVRREGQDTWQGTTGHNTLGMYATHAATDTYSGYFSVFGRGETPQRALALARG